MKATRAEAEIVIAEIDAALIAEHGPTVETRTSLGTDDSGRVVYGPPVAVPRPTWAHPVALRDGRWFVPVKERVEKYVTGAVEIDPRARR